VVSRRYGDQHILVSHNCDTRGDETPLRRRLLIQALGCHSVQCILLLFLEMRGIMRKEVVSCLCEDAVTDYTLCEPRDSQIRSEKVKKVGVHQWGLGCRIAKGHGRRQTEAQRSLQMHAPW